MYCKCNIKNKKNKEYEINLENIGTSKYDIEISIR